MTFQPPDQDMAVVRAQMLDRAQRISRTAESLYRDVLTFSPDRLGDVDRELRILEGRPGAPDE